MKRMMARCLAAALVLAAQPVMASPQPPRPEIWVMDADGTGQRPLATDLNYGYWDASWSPDSSELVVSGLAVFDAASGERRQLRDEGWDPDWSKATGEIVFLADGALRSIHREGTGERVILTAEGGINHPAWSPDGSKIAFVSGGGEGKPGQISIVNSDGSGLRQVSTVGSLFIAPQWSADGDEVAFLTFDYDVYVVSVDGTNERLVMVDAADPSWCPDGRLALSHYIEGRGRHEVLLVDESGDATSVTPGGAPDCGPGNRIAFAIGSDVHVIDPAEAGTPNLTNTPDRDDWSPLWSPDGSKIAYVSAAQLPPPSTVEREVEADLVRHLFLRGEVTTSENACLPGLSEARKLKVQRLASSEWRTIARRAVDQEGRFRVRLRDRPGVYRVVLPEGHDSFGTYHCERVTSSLMEHRH